MSDITAPEADTTGTTDTIADPSAIRLGDPRDDREDHCTARRYTHPALAEGRVVVRLSAAALGPAEDLAAEFLGLSPAVDPGAGTPVEPVVVGTVARSSIGFPAWALVHDPANGHHALDAVKAMDKIARRLESKPGLAMEGFEELAGRLGRAVPHFLPTYWEQVGRLCLRAEAGQQASVCFGRARKAESEHGLPVDDERLRAVFLEFAEAGALTVKALRDHSRGLGTRLTPEAAYRSFRTLCVERCVGGMAPYATMGEDLKRLARTAKLDIAAEQRLILAELLPTAALGRAPFAFWKSYRAALIDLAQQEAADADAVRSRILEITPATDRDHQDETDAFWLDVIADSGARALLEADGRDAVHWLNSWEQHRHGRGRVLHRIPAELELAAAVAPAVRAAAAEFAAANDEDAENAECEEHAEYDYFPTFSPFVRRNFHSWRHIQPDLLDVCLAEGIPVCDPDERTSFRLETWIAEDAPGRRELTAIAADPRFTDLLDRSVTLRLDAVSDTEQNPELLDGVAEHPVLRESAARWLIKRAARLTGGGPAPVATLNQELRTLGALPHRGLMALVPEAAAAIAGLDTAAALARTLREGIFDELGWPALEEAHRELTVPYHGRLGLHAAWPDLVLQDGQRLVVAGPDGVRLIHNPPNNPARGWNTRTVEWADGELMVGQSHWEHDPDSYWTGDVNRHFRHTADDQASSPAALSSYGGVSSLPLPGGGRYTGVGILRAGDIDLPVTGAAASDGTRLWGLRKRPDQQSWYVRGPAEWMAVDPATGEWTSPGAPEFFTAPGGDPENIEPRSCMLAPVPEGLAGTPFGTKGGLLGWRIVRRDGTWHGESVDGRSTPGGPHTGSTYQQTLPFPPMRMPGGTEVHLELRSETLVLWSPSDGHLLALLNPGTPGSIWALGTPLVPPLQYWHALRPRDEQGSAALRTLTDTRADALLSTARTAYDGSSADRSNAVVPAEVRPGVEAAVRAALPEITHPGLLAGIIGILGAACAAASRIDLIRAESATPATSDHQQDDTWQPVEHAHDTALFAALESLIPDGISRWETPPAGRPDIAARQLHAVGRALADPEAAGEQINLAGFGTPGLPQASPRPLHWWHTLGTLGTVALRAAHPATPEADRPVLLDFLDRIAEAGPLADVSGRLRRVIVHPDEQRELHAGRIIRTRTGTGTRTLVLLCEQHRNWQTGQVHWFGLEHAPDGEFGPIEGFGLSAEAEVIGGFGGTDTLHEFTALLREHGPIAPTPEQTARLVEATGMVRPAAVLLRAGLPKLSSYDKYFLPADTRKLLNLSTDEAELGRRALRNLHWEGFVRTDGAARRAASLMPDQPERLWSSGPDTERAAADWNATVGQRVAVTGELLARAAKEGGLEATITALLEPHRLDDHRMLRIGWSRALGGLRWLAYRLPHGDPQRAMLPAALTALRDRLAAPDFTYRYHVGYPEADLPSRLRQAYGAGQGQNELGTALRLVEGGESPFLAIRTAAYFGPDGEPSAGAAELTQVRNVLLALNPGRNVTNEIDTLIALLPNPEGPEPTSLDRMVAADGPPGHPQNPVHSVPELVAEAAKQHGLDEDAAALYLMLLALPDPTDRNVKEWTGWQQQRGGTTRFKKAVAVLAATDLVVEAKRPRAGRSLFLPGAWESRNAPALPLERWKLPLYGPPANRQDTVLLPAVPTAELHHQAWQRTQQDDPPALDPFTPTR